MRTIKFRAQDFTGTWNYGFPVIGNEGAIIMPLLPNGSVMMGIKTYVTPETIGQFTDFFDVDGKEVYEGDVVEIIDKETVFPEKKCVVEFIDNGFQLVIIGRKSKKKAGASVYYHPMNLMFRVIGNKHDNPELLNEKVH